MVKLNSNVHNVTCGVCLLILVLVVVLVIRQNNVLESYTQMGPGRYGSGSTDFLMGTFLKQQ